VIVGALVALVLSAVVVYSDHHRASSSLAPHPARLRVALVANGKDKDKDDKKNFQISGQVSGLYPGAQKQLNLSVSNPNNFAINVTSLTVTVGSPGVVGCAQSNVAVTNFSGSLIVAKNATVTKSLPINMLSSAPDQCRGATFPLTFGGTAEKS
jgi:hypothetical protein